MGQAILQFGSVDLHLHEEAIDRGRLFGVGRLFVRLSSLLAAGGVEGGFGAMGGKGVSGVAVRLNRQRCLYYSRRPCDLDPDLELFRTVSTTIDDLLILVRVFAASSSDVQDPPR